MAKQLGKWLFIRSLFIACAVAAWLLAPVLEVNIKIVLLAAMILAYLLISACLELFRHRLRKRLGNMTAEERAVLSESEPEVRYAIPAPGSVSSRITTLAGAVAVNGLVLPLLVGPLALLQYVFDIHDALASALCLALGFILAWTWWSIGVTVWRWWATTHRGMPPDEVQWRGEAASFLWPKNHFFERTEFGNIFFRRKRK